MALSFHLQFFGGKQNKAILISSLYNNVLFYAFFVASARKATVREDVSCKTTVGSQAKGISGLKKLLA